MRMGRCFKRVVAGLLLAGSPVILQAQQAADPSDAVDGSLHQQLIEQLRKTRSVELFLVSRTGTYDYAEAQVREQSTIRIHRACGGNCHRVMEAFLQTVESALPVDCPPGGQQSGILSLAEGVVVELRYSGRLLQFQGQCAHAPDGYNRALIDGMVGIARL
ncbi:MAG: hypothetical protein ACXIUZ_05450 [Lysobacteraceae bacterium]